MLDLKQRIEEGIRPLVEESGLDLVETQLSAPGYTRILRIFVDRLKGVSVGELAALSRRIGDFLEQENLIAENYKLEISSPGLDRPLVSRADFARKVGERIKVYFKDKGRKENEGVIAGVNEVELVMTQDGNEVRIDLDTIEKGLIQF